MEKKKITVSVSQELFDWCLNVSDSMGLSVPALFVVAMAQYKQQQESLSMMGDVQKLIDAINAKPLT